METGPFEVSAPTQLLRRVVELSSEFERELGRQLGVNPTDLSAMEHLIQSGPLAPTDIARRLGLTTAAATTVIDRLSALGHVTRAPHPTDRRGILVSATEKSIAKAMGDLMPMILGIDAVSREFTAAEIDVVTTFLNRVVENYGSQVAAMAERES